LRESFKDKGVEVSIVSKEEPADRIRSAYMGLAPGVPVMVDESAEIADAYGIPAAPFFFALDEDNKIVQRIPYMPDTAAHLGKA